MSNYIGYAKNPETGEVEQAEFLDDYYGRHEYGVRFEDGGIYPIDDVELPESEE